jgi:hypothetical protein
MSVWLTIPSARPEPQAKAIIDQWRGLGYRVALWRESEKVNPMGGGIQADLVKVGPEAYPGYAIAVNQLIGIALRLDHTARWFVIGGDDVQPDLAHRADEIAAQCEDYFGTLANCSRHDDPEALYGVMQPTGDRWGDSRGAYIDRICGSAWIGREFAMRAYGGLGPLWPEYKHMFVDEELQNVARREGVLWQRRDLIQLHQHAQRTPNSVTPPHLREWYGRAHWDEAKALFTRRQAANFPPYEVEP